MLHPCTRVNAELLTCTGDALTPPYLRWTCHCEYAFYETAADEEHAQTINAERNKRESKKEDAHLRFEATSTVLHHSWKRPIARSRLAIVSDTFNIVSAPCMLLDITGSTPPICSCQKSLKCLEPVVLNLHLEPASL